MCHKKKKKNKNGQLRRRAHSHGGGGPQVGEVPRLPVVKKKLAFTCNIEPRGAGVRFGSDGAFRFVVVSGKILQFDSVNKHNKECKSYSNT